MTTFNQKDITAPTLGEKLQQVRQGQGLSLEEISPQIKVKKEYLEFLEQGKYDLLPSAVFVENYLKVYSQFLNIPWDKVKKVYYQEKKSFQTDYQPSQKSAKHHGRPALLLPKFLTIALVFIALLVFFIYLGLQINNFLQPPSLELSSPVDNLTVTERFIEVAGKTVPEAQILINNQEIAVDNEGNFNELVSLQPGLNTLEITAKTKHSREYVVYKQIIVDN